MRISSWLLLPLLLTACNQGLPIERCQNVALTGDGRGDFISNQYSHQETRTPQELEEAYGYRGDVYQVESLYYSADWDVLYVSYFNPTSGARTGLDEAGLADLEEYLLTNVHPGRIVDDPASWYRPEYHQYLKIVRLYADDVAVACVGDGCSSASHTDGFIDVYGVREGNIFTSSTSKEPRINVLVHEYGHIFNYYNLHYLGDLSPTTYLKARLGEKFNQLYPKGVLPPTSTNPGFEYYLWPTEIEADDFVELFYSNYDPSTYRRQSLKDYPSVAHLSDQTVRQQILDLYSASTSYDRVHFDRPKVIETTCNSCELTYYTDNYQTKTMKKMKYKQQLIAIGMREHQGVWYYEVIISPLMKRREVEHFYSLVATRTGYVEAKNYQETEREIFALDPSLTIGVCSYTKVCTGSKALGYQIQGGYRFSYLINLIEGNETITSYEYLVNGEQVLSVNRDEFKPIQ